MRRASLVSGLLAARAAAQLATFKQCEVRIEALERGGGCLAVDAAAINDTLAPPEGTTVCDDSATWTDGTNGCAQYEAAAARGDKWRAEFGSLGASTECCVCGGGRTRAFKYKVGDAVVVRPPNARAPLDGVVHAVRPAAGFAYDVKVTARFRKPAVYRVKSEDDLQPGRRPRDGLLLQPCASSPSLRWRLDIEGDDAVLEHAETNCTVGNSVDGGRSDSLRYADETRTPLTFRKLGRWDVYEISRESSVRECLVGGKFGKPALEQATWEACGGPNDGLPSRLWRIRCDAGDEEDGALVERIDALLARQDASTLPPWEVLGVARNAEPAAVKGAFRDLSRLLHPDKRSWLGRKISGEKLVRACVETVVSTPTPSTRRLLDGAGLRLTHWLISTQVRADALFATAQEAYDGLKSGDAKAREKLRSVWKSNNELGDLHAIEATETTSTRGGRSKFDSHTGSGWTPKRPSASSARRKMSWSCLPRTCLSMRTARRASGPKIKRWRGSSCCTTRRA